MEVEGQVAEQANSPKTQHRRLRCVRRTDRAVPGVRLVLAALLPLITAGIALGVGMSVIGLLSHVLTMADFSSELSLLIGLGVGVDYALFIVTRYRQGLRAGQAGRGRDRRRARHLRAAP